MEISEEDNRLIVNNLGGKGLIYSKQISMFGKPQVVGYSKGTIYVMEIDKTKANDIITKNHYSHKIYNGTYI